MKERNGLPERKKSEHITKELINAIESIGYGEVVVTIHNFEVVQIEKREKKRFK
jgi:hypothetical protein